MKRTVIEGNQVTTYDSPIPNRTYEIVDSIPEGYIIWNIGDHAPDGFVPICTTLGNTANVDPDSLKAVPSEHAAEIMAAAGCGAITPAMAQRIIEAYESGEGVSKWAYDGVKSGYDLIMELPWEGLA